jgi:hypothetical protein
MPTQAQEETGYLYPVVGDPVYGINGGPVEGPVGTLGVPLTAAAAAALIQKEVG